MESLQNIGVGRHVDVRLANLQLTSELALIIHFKILAPRHRRTLWQVHWALKEWRQEGDWFDVNPAKAMNAIQDKL